MGSAGVEASQTRSDTATLSGVKGSLCKWVCRVVLSRLYAKREVVAALQPTPQAAARAKEMLEL